MRISAGLAHSATLLFLAPDTSYPKPISRHPHPVDAYPPFMYLEPSLVDTPRFLRHLIDKRRHLLDLTDSKAPNYFLVYQTHRECGVAA
jgi:hypothetical protein